MCVSTAIAGCPIENDSTTPAVLGPTPGIARSHAFASSSGMVSRNEMSNPPVRSRTEPSACWMRGAFWFASPPLRMVSARSASGAFSTSSHVS